LGSYELGLYQTAYRVAILPVSEGGEVFNKVTFPFYVKISNDRQRLRRVFLKIMAITSAFVIPFGLILIIFPNQFTRLVLGEQWLSAASVLPYLAIYAIIRSILGTSQSIFLALKKQNYVTVITFVGLMGMGMSIFPLVKALGIVGAGISALIGWMFAAALIFYYLRKVFG